MKLSEDLQQCHDCGDFGQGLEGFTEDARKLELELDAYKAHVAELKGAIEKCMTLEFDELSQWDRETLKILKKTPAQSLGDVRAKAVMKFGKFITGSDFALEWERLTIQDMAKIVEDYANKLKEGKA